MCGRFYVERSEESGEMEEMLAEAFGRLQRILGAGEVAQNEVFPSAIAAVRAMGKNGGIGTFPMRWGLQRPDGKGLIINTRSETALEKPLFRGAMLERRCLIPITWYYEWETREAGQDQKEPENMPSLQIYPAPLPGRRAVKGALKIKYAIRPPQQGILYLAGIYRYEPGQALPAFSVLTRKADASIAFIHDRMPVIFSAENAAAWLDRQADPEKTLALAQDEMRFHRA